MKEYLYQVNMKDDKTGEVIKLRVWAENVYEATHKVTSAIGGYRSEYSWQGSGPVHENNNLVSRDVTD